MKLKLSACVALALIGLAACNRAEAPKAAEAADVVAAGENAPAGPCNVSLEAPWAAPAPTGATGIVVTARATGPSCVGAAATLIMKDANGVELVKFEAPLTQMPVIFTGTPDAAALRTELGQWLDQNEDLNTTGKLPEWKAGAAQPVSGEFPFYPEEGVTRDVYQAYRAKDAPMFCFVQGAESQACFMHDAAAGKIVRIGAQSFPG
jgi:hypothetical protein